LNSGILVETRQARGGFWFAGRLTCPIAALANSEYQQTRRRGADRVGWVFTFAAAAYNLVRMRNLLPIAT
jgi:hypothetical protein